MTDKQRNIAWHLLSLFLLAMYLTCFHCLNAADPEQVKFLGSGFGSAWLATCFVCQSLFRNRFEFAIHTLVAIDFMLEGMIPVHSGYGFYFCAAAFWAVFLVYHYLPNTKPASRLKTQTTVPDSTAQHQPTV